jgi:hypothetical protein
MAAKMPFHCRASFLFLQVSSALLKVDDPKTKKLPELKR